MADETGDDHSQTREVADVLVDEGGMTRKDAERVAASLARAGITTRGEVSRG